MKHVHQIKNLRLIILLFVRELIGRITRTRSMGKILLKRFAGGEKRIDVVKNDFIAEIKDGPAETIEKFCPKRFGNFDIITMCAAEIDVFFGIQNAFRVKFLFLQVRKPV